MSYLCQVFARSFSIQCSKKTNLRFISKSIIIINKDETFPHPRLFRLALVQCE